MTTAAQGAAGAQRRARHERLASVMERSGLEAILLRQPANFAWYTGGADNRVNHADGLGVASIVVTADAEYVLANNIEAPRLRDEQTPDMEFIEYPWHDDPVPVLRHAIGAARLGADAPFGEAVNVSGEIAPLRYVLDAEAIARYRQVGADAALAMMEAAEAVRPGMTEYDAAALVRSATMRHKLYAPVVLVAADGRIANYRHPIPQGTLIERRVMLVLCAERGGLVANVTRFVDFVPPDDETRRRQQACETILRRMRLEATVPGHTLADAFRDCQRFYAEAGYPDEWRLHHQGGLTGYASRELLATPRAAQRIEVGQAFAWNPSIAGTKAEETFILTEAGPEVI